MNTIATFHQHKFTSAGVKLVEDHLCIISLQNRYFQFKSPTDLFSTWTSSQGPPWQCCWRWRLYQTWTKCIRNECKMRVFVGQANLNWNCIISLCGDDLQPQGFLPPRQLCFQLGSLLSHLSMEIDLVTASLWKMHFESTNTIMFAGRPTWPSLLTTVLWSLATSASFLSALPTTFATLHPALSKKSSYFFHHLGILGQS